VLYIPLQECIPHLKCVSTLLCEIATKICSDNSVKGFLISVHCCSLDIFALNRWTINCNSYGNSASDEVVVA